MSNLLYLVHRLPFPPNKGDKVRSYHLLKHLMLQHRVFLGTFVDTPEDEAYVEDVRRLCPDCHIERLQPLIQKIISLSGFFSNQPLTVNYYFKASFQAWVNKTLEENSIDAIVIFSSVMAQYVTLKSTFNIPPILVDFVDVDSEKWRQYASAHHWPHSWVYRREGRLLRAFETSVAQRSKKSFFVTESEAALFKLVAPACASKLLSLSNGVDTHFYSPELSRISPFDNDRLNDKTRVIVFTGAMDYWPNVDAVVWFVHDIWPTLRQLWPQLRFYIVGRNPSPSVWALVSPSVVVTGTVADVRPYLQYAALVVAPLRVSRGVQNKILEAMAMARPVVASAVCAKAINAGPCELVSASGVNGFLNQINDLLSAPLEAEKLGQMARQRVIEVYGWTAHLSGIDPYLLPPSTEGHAV
jgi:sugar transferase (PEP-CTERM/EpsH1 system associated)